MSDEENIWENLNDKKFWKKLVNDKEFQKKVMSDEKFQQKLMNDEKIQCPRCETWTHPIFYASG